MKLLCCGDSNTYGYDPRGFFGGRYDESQIWCSLLEQALGCEVRNAGENGRTIPDDDWHLQELCRLITREKPDMLVLLLGTNDILTGKGTPDEISGRMERLIKALKRQFPKLSILLLSPPPMALPEFMAAAQAVAAGYRAISERENVAFGDCFHWKISLSYDGVHFSPEGHQAFAEYLMQILHPFFPAK